MELVTQRLELIPKVYLYVESKPFSEHCQINARNDLEAVECWLKGQANPHTYRAYLREIKRFLLFSYGRGLALSQLKIQDIENYFEELKAHALSDSVCKMSLRAMSSLMNYLVNAHYLRVNPIKLLPRSVTKGLDLDAHKYEVWERILEEDEWQVLQDCLDEMPEDSQTAIDHKIRTQFLFALLYIAGLRIHEAAGLSWDAFRKLGGEWVLVVQGKGNKKRDIVVNDQLLAYMQAYRLSLKKSALSGSEEREPLFVSKKTGKALSIRQLFNLIKALGIEASKKFVADPEKAAKLSKFSAHWLRHLCASHQDKFGVPEIITQEMLGHSSPATTRIYKHSENKRKREEMQKIKLKGDPKFVEVKPKEAAILVVKIKTQPISNHNNLLRLLQGIEGNVLKRFKQIKKRYNSEEILNGYENLKQFGMAVELKFSLDGLSQDEIALVQKVIKREANIRLFECEIEWQGA